MYLRRYARAPAVALLAACALVLQSFLAAWAAGAMPSAAMLDAFGNPLCITSTDHDEADRSGGHTGAADECLACCMALSQLAPSYGAGAVLLTRLRTDDHRLLPRRGPDVRSPDHDPGNPRAPPPAA